MMPMLNPETDSAHRTATASLTDEEIVCELRNVRDQRLADDLFAELFRRYELPVRLWCLRFTSDRNHTFDLMQEIFFKVYRNMHCYRGDSKFSTWLYAIAHNHCCNSRKRKAAEPVERASLISALQRDFSVPDPDAAIERSQSARLIRQLFSSALNPLEARIMSMHYGREIPLSAITQELGLSNRSGAKAYIVNARRKLNRALGHKKLEGGVMSTLTARAESELAAWPNRTKSK
jgi:RNA polymerase sigma-70 factor (ECF subfamily)